MPAHVETWVRWLTFVPIIACSVVGFALTLLKWLHVRRPIVPPASVSNELVRLIEQRAYDEARELAGTDPSKAAWMAWTLLGRAGRSREALRDRAEYEGHRIAGELEYGLGGLSLLATLGPLLGLFGTVVGILLVFDRLATLEGAAASPQQLAGGIGTALYTTVGGLIVGMLSLVTHRYYQARVDRMMGQLESFTVDLVETLNGTSR